ncbi:hypothetical protein PILCRDRAFT_815222 [Piloderma croceum F 1598]|uniref:Uncharacterized protein n=1 Tax=Piloderma croceum (strain F 1598) TaxID=765440 RepID=A0A0C3GAK0_PILCF|nr:hypothetical protein PILCRDRAFT_815222 [Piloderma croceum F 1598]
MAAMAAVTEVQPQEVWRLGKPEVRELTHVGQSQRSPVPCVFGERSRGGVLTCGISLAIFWV